MAKADHHIRIHFLDGIRGWAALMVLLCHVFVVFPAGIISQYFLNIIPFLNGTLAVWTFFIISGFALSVRYCFTKNRDILIRISLGRYFRLAIPIFFVSILIFLSFWFKLIPSVTKRPELLQNYLMQAPTLWETIKFSIYDVFFKYQYSQTLIPPAWTMTFEIWGSFLVICTLATIGSSPKRTFVYPLLIFISYFINSYYTAFLIGLVFAEIYSLSSPDLTRKLTFTSKLLLLPALIACMTLHLTVMQKMNNYLIISSLLTFCLIFNATAVKFLSCKLSYFFGKISYPLYLSHGLVMSYTTNLINISHLQDVSILIKFIIGLSMVGICILFAWSLRFTDTISIQIGRIIGNLFFEYFKPIRENNNKISYQKN